jgi:hypothetical protein
LSYSAFEAAKRPSTRAPKRHKQRAPCRLYAAALPHFFFCAADNERPAAAKRQSALSSSVRLAFAKRQSALSSVRLAAYMLPHLLFFCAADDRLAFASLRLRLDCFYTCTFTPGLRPFLTASAPARVQFLGHV